MIGDADFIADKRWSAENKNRDNFSEGYSLRNDNNNFIQNIIEQLNGGEDLISIRSRSIHLPPFKIVKELENDAGQKYEDAMLAVDERLKEIQAEKRALLGKIK